MPAVTIWKTVWPHTHRYLLLRLIWKCFSNLWLRPRSHIHISHRHVSKTRSFSLSATPDCSQLTNGEVFAWLMVDVSYFYLFDGVYNKWSRMLILMHLNSLVQYLLYIVVSTIDTHNSIIRCFGIVQLTNGNTSRNFQCTLTMWRCGDVLLRTMFVAPNRPEQNSMYNSELGFKWPLEQYTIYMYKNEVKCRLILWHHLEFRCFDFSCDVLLLIK